MIRIVKEARQERGVIFQYMLHDTPVSNIYLHTYSTIFILMYV